MTPSRSARRLTIPAPTDRSAAAAKARARILATVRRRRGWSQEQAAQRFGVTVTTWSRWERGVQAIGSAQFQAIVIVAGAESRSRRPAGKRPVKSARRG